MYLYVVKEVIKLENRIQEFHKIKKAIISSYNQLENTKLNNNLGLKQLGEAQTNLSQAIHFHLQKIKQF